MEAGEPQTVGRGQVTRKGVWEESRGRGPSIRGHSLSWSRSSEPNPLREIPGAQERN